VDDPRVASMLQADFSRINEEFAAVRFKEDKPGVTKRRPSTTARRARPATSNET